MTQRGVNENVRYQPDEACSPLVAVAVGLQGVALVLAPTILIVAISVRAADQGDDYLNWAVLCALLINAAITALHATRAPRLGSGHIVITGPTVQFVAITIVALSEGGPDTLASLLVVCAFVQFAVALWLPLLRRIITPVVSGTVLMLVAVTLVRFGTDRLTELPEGAPAVAGPAVGALTLVVAVAFVLRGSGPWRQWSTMISIAAGCALTAALGQYEVQRVLDAPWLGFPEAQFPGLDLTPGPEFWALLPTFVVLTLVLCTKSISDSMIIQRASQREPRAVDFRYVQGTVSTNGLGMLLAGLTGTPPVQPYASFSTSLISFTGVASRRVGYAIALIFIVAAIFPKVGAVLLTIPSPVMGAYLILALGIIFVGGAQAAFQGGLDQQKTVIIGLSLALGLGLDNHDVIPHVLGDELGAVFGSGVLYGALSAILLTLILEHTGSRPRRLEAAMDVSALPAIDEFMRDLGSGLAWDEPSTERLRSVGEETLSSLAGWNGDPARESAGSLTITARPEAGRVELEFVAASDQENLEDQIAYLSDDLSLTEVNDMSLRLLRHQASSVSHQKYYGIDIVTVSVEGSP